MKDQWQVNGEDYLGNHAEVALLPRADVQDNITRTLRHHP